MLRRAENVTVFHSPGLLTKKGPLSIAIGSKTFVVGLGKVHANEFAQWKAQQMAFPVRWARVGDRSYYEFQNKFYWDNDDLEPQQVHALLVTRQQAQQRKLDRAEALLAMGSAPRKVSQRSHISDDVKQYVWARDQGRCRHCGATSELQYDHVIPIAMGGSSEPENLQILCGPCNRRKSAGLTVGTKRTQAATAPAPTHAAPTAAPAGWYPSESPEALRWWDGQAWTEHTHPARR